VSTSTGISLEDIKEICHTTISFGGQAKAEGGAEFVAHQFNLGSSVRFVDELYDADGKQIGTVQGYAVTFADTDGTIMQITSAVDEYEDGSVAWSGTYPMFPTGGNKTVPAYGLSGRYHGLIGTRGFQLLERPDAGTSIIKASLYLDGHAPEH
jgi:hypothetical protein